jgi:HSP20 family protein
MARRAPVNGGVRPARTDIVDTGSSYKVTAEVPGIPKEKLEIRVHGNSVEIRSEDDRKVEEPRGEYLHRERTYQGFYRAVELPEPVVAEKATAKVVDGVLELELPKQKPTPSPAEVRVPVE